MWECVELKNTWILYHTHGLLFITDLWYNLLNVEENEEGKVSDYSCAPALTKTFNACFHSTESKLSGRCNRTKLLPGPTWGTSLMPSIYCYLHHPFVAQGETKNWKNKLSTYNKIFVGHAHSTWVLPYMGTGILSWEKITDMTQRNKLHNFYLFGANPRGD